MSAVADLITARKKKNPNLRIGSVRKILESQAYAPLSTGNVAADYITGIGGILGVVELRGFMSSGKTTLAVSIAAEHQKKVYAGESTGAIMFLDFEYSADFEYFRNLGLNVDDEETFIYVQPDTLEQGFELFLEATKAGILRLGIVDSVAAASCKDEYESEIGRQFIGNRAKALMQVLRMSVGPMKVHGVSLLLLNHTQVKIAQTWGEKQAASRGIIDTVSPGGKSIEYMTNMRLETFKPSNNKEEALDVLTNEKSKQVTSTDVVITCFKNKLAAPHKTAKLRVTFGKGFNATYSSFHILVDNKLIKKKAGGTYTFPAALLPTPDTVVPRGEDNILAVLEENPEWAEILNKAARALVLKFQSEPAESEVVVEDVSDDNIDLETGEVLDD